MISEFKCPKKDCESTSLYLFRREDAVTELEYKEDGIDFDYGKEEVVGCSESVLTCGGGHVLHLKGGAEVSDFDEFLEWRKEQED